MRTRHSLAIACALGCGLATNVPYTVAQSYDISVYPGERLTYVIEYMAMEIATIRLTVLDPVDTLGAVLHHVRAEVNSNPRLPLITVNDVYESYFDDDFLSYYYRGQGVTRNYAFRVEYVFDYTNKDFRAREYRRKGRDEQLYKDIHQTLDANLHDSVTFFYLLRWVSKSLATSGHQKIPVFASLKTAPMEIWTDHEIQQVRAIDQEYTAIPVNLKLGLEGICGLQDVIKVNCSTDGLAIPLNGEIKVVVGKVKFRLVDFVPGRLPYTQTATSAQPPAPSTR